MAGVKAIVTTDIDIKLAALAQQIDDPTPIFGIINEYLLQSTRARFGPQISPNGEKWAVLSPRYAKKKRKNKNKILTLEGDLQRYLRGKFDRTGLEFGTNSPYGAIHQFGGVFNRTSKKGKQYAFKMTARPWLGLSSEDKSVILKKTQQYLKRAISA